MIAAQLDSPTDLKTYVAAGTQGTQSEGGASGFVSVRLVTDALDRLGVDATYEGPRARRC
jgi:hypothetical protein